MSVGDRLKQLRESHGLNLQQAGDIAGTTKQSASQIEKGVTKVPGGLFLYRWSQHYGVSLEWLITGKGSKRQSQSQTARLTGDIILAAYQEAVTKFETAGLSGISFRPMTEPEHAELLALGIIAHLTTPEDSQIQADVEVGRGATRKDRAGSGAVGDDSAAEAGSESRPATGKRKKRAA